MFATSTLGRPTNRASIFLREVSPAQEEQTDGIGASVLYTIGEACQVLKVSRWTLYELIRKRQLGTITIGKRRLVPAAAIDALINRLTEETL